MKIKKIGLKYLINYKIPVLISQGNFLCCKIIKLVVFKIKNRVIVFMTR